MMTDTECTAWIAEHAPDDVALHVAMLHLDKGSLSVDVEHLKSQLVKIGQGLLDDVVSSCANKERVRFVEEIERLKRELAQAHVVVESWTKRAKAAEAKSK